MLQAAKILTRQVAAVLVVLSIAPALARNAGQWDDTATSVEVHQWYAKVTRPDSPGYSCCGDADAYYADSYRLGPNGEYIAILTDERDAAYDRMAGRITRAPGTEFVVPQIKFQTKYGNPTGHGVVFIGSTTGEVLCYIQPGGV